MEEIQKVKHFVRVRGCLSFRAALANAAKKRRGRRGEGFFWGSTHIMAGEFRAWGRGRLVGKICPWVPGFLRCSSSPTSSSFAGLLLLFLPSYSSLPCLPSSLPSSSPTLLPASFDPQLTQPYYFLNPSLHPLHPPISYHHYPHPSILPAPPHHHLHTINTIGLLLLLSAIFLLLRPALFSLLSALILLLRPALFYYYRTTIATVVITSTTISNIFTITVFLGHKPRPQSCRLAHSNLRTLSCRTIAVSLWSLTRSQLLGDKIGSSKIRNASLHHGSVFLADGKNG